MNSDPIKFGLVDVPGAQVGEVGQVGELGHGQVHVLHVVLHIHLVEVDQLRTFIAEFLMLFECLYTKRSRREFRPSQILTRAYLGLKLKNEPYN